MAHLRLRLLGGFEAAWPSGASVPLPSKKARALLAYCALRPGQAFQRDALATLLWGDTEDAKARNSLRQILFVLRETLGEAWSAMLRIEGDAISTDPSALDVDVVRFERLASELAPQALAEAAALYTGDLLEGFLVDEEPFEEWLRQERERLRDLVLEVLAKLLRHQEAAGMAGPAIETARRLLVLDPLQEVVHRVLMRLYAQDGRREAAIRQYEVCVGVLRRELRMEPEPETRQIHEWIQAGPWPVPSPHRGVSGNGARKTGIAAPVFVAEEAAGAVNGDATHALDAPHAESAPHGGTTLLPQPRPFLGERLTSLDERLTMANQAMSELSKVARVGISRARELRRISAHGRTTLRETIREIATAIRDIKEIAEGGDRDRPPSGEALAPEQTG